MILTDIHCHILPGIDDGAADMDMKKNMLNKIPVIGKPSVKIIQRINNIYPLKPVVLRGTIEPRVSIVKVYFVNIYCKIYWKKDITNIFLLIYSTGLYIIDM